MTLIIAGGGPKLPPYIEMQDRAFPWSHASDATKHAIALILVGFCP